MLHALSFTLRQKTSHRLYVTLQRDSILMMAETGGERGPSPTGNDFFCVCVVLGHGPIDGEGSLTGFSWACMFVRKGYRSARCRVAVPTG